MSLNIKKIVKIPEDVNVELTGKLIKVSGEKGSLIRSFSHASVEIVKKNNEIIVFSLRPRRKEISLVGTISSHIQNMIIGVTNGYTYKLKIVYSHFPISVKIADKQIIIENFIGERNPRIAKIVGETKVIVGKDDVYVQGVNIEEVSQTAANIQQKTKIKKKDPRVFLDGIYVYERMEGYFN